MKNYLRIAGYAFLSLSGAYAWLSTETGWRHYAGMIMFFAVTLRLLSIITPKKSSK